MFTGIIEGLGKIKRRTMKGADAVVEIEAVIRLKRCVHRRQYCGKRCLSYSYGQNRIKLFSADVSAETLGKTTLKFLQAGDKVNLEKSLRAGGYMGGHFVLGHVDATGRILSQTQKSGSLILAVEINEKLSRYIVEKGSVAVDGISLTVNKLEKGRFYVNIIPHTMANTTLVMKKEADWVNIETDILGKYVEKLLHSPRGIDKDFLTEHGFM